MASRLQSASVVALIVLLAACTEPEAASTPTAPPDAFAPTPSIENGSNLTTTTTRRVTTTTVDVERAAIYPVDPRTLEAVPGFEPMPMGDWVWGRSSPDGAYLAVGAGNDVTGTSEMRLIDVAGWTLVGSWRENTSSQPLVTDDGTVYFYSPTNALRSLRAGVSTSDIVAEPPLSAYMWSLDQLGDHLLVAYGGRNVGDGAENGAIIVTDLDAALATSIDLPGVRIGSVDPLSTDPWNGYLWTSPVYALDPVASRALVVHGDGDVVSEVDLISGSVVEHDVPGLGSGLDDPSTTSLERSAMLSPSGKVLYVASTLRRLEVDGEQWSVVANPVGVAAIDTTTWQVLSRLEEPIGHFILSPRGDRILATGYTATESLNSYQWSSTDLYLLDTTPLSVLARQQPAGPEYGFAPLSFNDAARVGYATSWEQQARLLAIDLDTGEITAEATSTGYLEIFGDIAVMSETS